MSCDKCASVDTSSWSLHLSPVVKGTTFLPVSSGLCAPWPQSRKQRVGEEGEGGRERGKEEKAKKEGTHTHKKKQKRVEFSKA